MLGALRIRIVRELLVERERFGLDRPKSSLSPLQRPGSSGGVSTAWSVAVTCA
ncbi:hypothetical protein [Streptosporangium saharense]|uniref:Uncharacterized protein n=1 Tax=Streptosporangium saharense TaxID=1706840 RepID=A0A7W7QLJ6_9ACTN|nr:hypothetical protein [Streptosporangium saharense]MBB4915804.1 hypothetical protein [Streptosporangium saharense]